MIVTATGLNVLMLGGMKIGVDGREIELSEAVSYKGMMFGGVPNLAYALGYTNASWTLKCDLVAEHVCRLLDHMDEHGYTQCTPSEPDPALETQPFIDLTSGYVLRSIDALPKQGTQGAVAAPPELRPRHPPAAARRAAGRGDGVLDAGAGGDALDGLDSVGAIRQPPACSDAAGSLVMRSRPPRRPGRR